MLQRTCRECASTFTPNTGNQVYCTRRCKKRAENRTHRARQPRHTLTCVKCGATFEAVKPDATTCSQRCKRVTHGAYIGGATPGHPRRVRAQRRLDRAARGTTRRRPEAAMVAGQCARCGSWFVDPRTRGGPNPSMYCSPSCASRTAKDRRRAREANAETVHYRRSDIFERDGWTCHICGDPIDPSCDWNEPGAATLDHVIPLARDGADVPSNVAAAHRSCNSIKSDRLDYQAAEGWGTAA